MARKAQKITHLPILILARSNSHNGFQAYMVAAFISVTASILPSYVFSAQNLPLICDQAAAYAAQKTGVPVSVLQAISITETGRKTGGVLRPWPWTVNMEGKGKWFDNEDEARAYVYKNYKRGARSFDVGCFQINYKWHGHAFTSIAEMFDPAPNALYAAKFLLKLYNEKGSWDKAAGAYHSRTLKHATKYEKRFKTYHAAIIANGKTNSLEYLASSESLSSTLLPKVLKPRVNHYPLLQQNGETSGFGSLAPLPVDQVKRKYISLGNDNG